MAHAVLAALEDNSPGTAIFVGHDTDIAGLGAVLGLHWSAEPWSDDSTLPASMLRLDSDHRRGLVRAAYHYPKDVPDDGGWRLQAGRTRFSPATPAGASPAEASLPE